MDVYDFCAICCDDAQTVQIYDMNPAVEHELFIGTMAEACICPWNTCRIWSFDLYPGMSEAGICLNIDTSEE